MQESAQRQVRKRILIAGGGELVRRGIRDVLGRERRFGVVGEVARLDELLPAYLEVSPDLVLLALAGPREDPPGPRGALAALGELLRADGEARVIVLSESEDAGDWTAPARSGAKGVLLADAPATTLLEAADDVLAGGVALDPRLLRALFDEWRAAGRAGRPEQEDAAELAPAVLRLLSPREREVLRALAQGRRNKEIAAELGVSVGTVKTHLRHIFRKLAVADRTGAVLTALQVRLGEAA
jgi:DNA-binding NarL/FixJ family response regulator